MSFVRAGRGLGRRDGRPAGEALSRDALRAESAPASFYHSVCLTYRAFHMPCGCVGPPSLRDHGWHGGALRRRCATRARDRARRSAVGGAGPLRRIGKAGFEAVSCAVTTIAYTRTADRLAEDAAVPGPAAACSFGNGGAIGPKTCTPFPMPGMLRKIPNWSLDPRRSGDREQGPGDEIRPPDPALAARQPRRPGAEILAYHPVPARARPLNLPRGSGPRAPC